MDATGLIFGEALLYYKDYVGDGSETLPSPDAAEDAIAYGDPWNTDPAWTETGYTQDGMTVSISTDREPIEVDQELDALFLVVTGREVSLNTNLAEFEMATLQLATGQGNVTELAPGAGTHGHETWELAGYQADAYYNVGMDVLQPANSEPLRVGVWKGLPVGQMEASFGNRSDNAQIPFEVRALPDTGTSPPRVITVVRWRTPTA